MKVICLCGETFETNPGIWVIPNHTKDGKVCPGSFIIGCNDAINLTMINALNETAPEEITGWRVKGQAGSA